MDGLHYRCGKYLDSLAFSNLWVYFSTHCLKVNTNLSVKKRITAMALVWQYGEKSGFESWKGLSWGMVSKYLFVFSMASCYLGIEC